VNRNREPGEIPNRAQDGRRSPAVPVWAPVAHRNRGQQSPHSNRSLWDVTAPSEELDARQGLASQAEEAQDGHQNPAVPVWAPDAHLNRAEQVWAAGEDPERQAALPLPVHRPDAKVDRARDEAAAQAHQVCPVEPELRDVVPRDVVPQSPERQVAEPVPRRDEPVVPAPPEADAAELHRAVLRLARRDEPAREDCPCLATESCRADCPDHRNLEGEPSEE
jgi:hypothetical protein